MKNKYLQVIFFFITLSANAQTVSAGFQEMNLGTTGYYNGSDLSGGFVSGPIFFRNEYNVAFSSWSGFGISAKTDTSNGTFNNQYSCYAGTGGNGSNQYAIAYCYSRIFIKPENPQQTLKLTAFQYSNSTWAGRSMKYGDAFSKKFGGVSGNDPDYFKLRIFNYFQGQIMDSADVFLADYRFDDPALDYVVKDWRTANFNFSHPSDSIGFSMESTDVGQFGINTPTYFCLDNLIFSDLTSVDNPILFPKLKAWPQPFTENLLVNGLIQGEVWEIFDARGKIMNQGLATESALSLMSTNNWKPGIYFLKQGGRSVKMVKN